MSAPPAAANLPSGPVSPGQRIESIDVLRGFAVLGILVMNIQSYAMIGSAYINPTAFGDLTGANYAVWLVCHVLADMKFMTIFSMLFGAGIIILTTRREAETGKSAGIHFRRMGWLLILGLLHGYVLWYGDILYTYAICGMLVYPLRRLLPKRLVTTGIACLAVGSGLSMLFHFSMPQWPPEVIHEIEQGWQPTGEVLHDEIESYRGNWTAQMAHRAESTFFFQTFLFLTEFIWRAAGLMLIGMGLFKLEVFSARRAASTYWSFIGAALIVGLPVVLYGVQRNEALGWDVHSCFFLGMQFNYWGSLLVSLGWIGLIMLICKHGLLRRTVQVLAAVGRMALTNYIMQSVICTFIFYGHGLALFGRVERTGQIIIVFAIFAFQLTFSQYWLRRFGFGPLEWLWRTLTYGCGQPMRRACSESVV